MPTETIVAPTVKQTAANIVKGATDKATGKAPTANKGPQKPEDGDEKNKPVAVATPDPNAGKEKYTVEGKDVWLTPEQARSYVQKGIAFEPRVSELDRMKREVALFEQALIENPGMVIANIAKRRNVPVQQLVENVLSSNASDDVKEATGKWYWENVAKRHQMDPKDRAILERDERIKILEDQEKVKAETAIALENKARVQQALALVSSQIGESLKELGLPDMNTVVGVQLAKRIADVMRISYLTKKPVTAKEAAAKVRAEIMQYQRAFYDNLDEDKLVEELGKENADKVRKYFLKLMKSVDKEHPKVSDEPKTKSGERKVITPDEMHDYLDNLKRNGKK